MGRARKLGRLILNVCPVCHAHEIRRDYPTREFPRDGGAPAFSAVRRVLLGSRSAGGAPFLRRTTARLARGRRRARPLCRARSPTRRNSRRNLGWHASLTLKRATIVLAGTSEPENDRLSRRVDVMCADGADLADFFQPAFSFSKPTWCLLVPAPGSTARDRSFAESFESLSLPSRTVDPERSPSVPRAPPLPPPPPSSDPPPAPPRPSPPFHSRENTGELALEHGLVTARTRRALPPGPRALRLAEELQPARVTPQVPAPRLERLTRRVPAPNAPRRRTRHRHRRPLPRRFAARR